MTLPTTQTAPGPSMERGRMRPDLVPENTDARLMLAFLRKEPSAAGALYDRYAPRIYGLGLTLLRNRTDAEDLVQDTFLKVWRRGTTFDPRRGPLDVWILLIARGLAIDLLRRRTLEAKRRSSEPRRSEASDGPGPEWYAEVRDSMRHVRSAMEQLPSSQRAALELAYLGERSSAQVAEVENIPLGTAKTRIRKGILTLRQILSEGGDVDHAPMEGGRGHAEPVRA